MRMCACSYVMYCALVAPMNNTAQGFGAFSGVSLQLSMSNNGITTVDPGFLSGIPCPVTVDLSQNNITQISTQSFQFMGSVNLSHNVWKAWPLLLWCRTACWPVQCLHISSKQCLYSAR
eukprot:m.537409 g.537409  ORF g.537409 m.537409 type:complete len:119 (+) comp22077_c0_seq5:90-446(+)